MSNDTTQYTPADVRKRVLTMLTAMEWAALVEHHDGRWYACCPWCGGENPDDDETPPGRAGHAERCELAAVIALLRTPRGEGEAEALAALVVRIWTRCQNEGPHYRETDEFWADFERAYQLAATARRGEGGGDGD